MSGTVHPERRTTGAGLIALVALLAAACGDGRLRAVSADWETGVAVLKLEGWAGHPVEGSLPLLNRGRGAVDLTVVPSGPFEVAASWRIPGGGKVLVPVRAVPSSGSITTGTILVRGGGAEVRVSVELSARAVPDCAQASPCRSSRFSVEAGVCLESNVADGTNCEDACLVEATCQAGQCVGRAKECTDGNACTLDVCTDGVGCTHVDESAACAALATDCRSAFCDPARGCRTVDVPDYTPCGPARCGKAPICWAGECRRVQAPEGSWPDSVCAEEVSTNWYFSCARTLEGEVVCWGDLKHADGGPAGPGPALVSLPGKADKLWMGGESACARLEDNGEVYCWGDAWMFVKRDYTFEGISYITTSRPVEIDSRFHGVVQMSFNEIIGCGVDTGGSLVCAGNQPNLRQVGYVNSAETLTLGDAAESGDYAVIHGGSTLFWSFYTFEGCAVPCTNSAGQKGICNSCYQSPPGAMPIPNDALRIETGECAACSLHSSGNAWCWGSNRTGVQGNTLDLGGSCFDAQNPHQVEGLADAVGLSIGRDVACAVLGDGGVSCWGFNPFRDADPSQPEVVPRPMPVAGLPAMKQVSISESRHACGVAQDSTVLCWGYNGQGRTLAPFSTTLFTEIRWDGGVQFEAWRRADGG